MRRGLGTWEDAVRVELHQIEETYRHLRAMDPERVARLASDLASREQMAAVLVVQTARSDRFVLVDGYHRLAALRTLGRDSVEILVLPCSEAEALVLGHRLAHARSRTACEDAWLVHELMEQHGLSQEAVARELHRSSSWVSRRLALLRVVPAALADRIRSGQVPGYAVMKYLVPLARANQTAASTLVENLGSSRWSVRELGRVYEAWRQARPERRAEILTNPRQAAAMVAELEQEDPLGKRQDSVAGDLAKDLRILSAVSVRARPKLASLAVRRTPLASSLARAHHELGRFVTELGDHLEGGASHGPGPGH